MFDNRISSANWNVYHSNQMYTNEIISLLLLLLLFLSCLMNDTDTCVNTKKLMSQNKMQKKKSHTIDSLFIHSNVSSFFPPIFFVLRLFFLLVYFSLGISPVCSTSSRFYTRVCVSVYTRCASNWLNEWNTQNQFIATHSLDIHDCALKVRAFERNKIEFHRTASN